MTKARRTGKVLIDWSQNDAQQDDRVRRTRCAPPRGPTASTPLDWDEVRAALAAPATRRGSRSRPAEVLARVAEHGDLFAPVLSLVQELPADGSRGSATRTRARSSRA